MEEKKYFLKLEEIDNEINKNNFKEAEEKLEQLYMIKPVRLQWFILKARLIYKTKKDYGEIWNILSEKGWGVYNYNSVSDYMRLYSKINSIYYDYSDSYRNRITAAYLECSEEEKIECEKVIDENIKRLDDNENKFLDGADSKQILKHLLEIQDCSLIFENKILYLLIMFLLDKMGVADYDKYNYSTTHREWIINMLNVGYLKEMLESEDRETFILVIDGNVKDYEVAAHIINKFNKQVFIINNPIEAKVNEKINIKDTVNVSIENSEEYYEGIKLINPIKLVKDGEVIGDNIDYVIDYICKNYTKDDLATVITSGKLIDELSLRPQMKKRLGRLSQFEAEYREENMAFGWVGNYLSYISRIYCLDVEKEINKPSECKFSIVIPARNSSYTLKETIKTCLNQRYQGSYEIVISDNSTNGNTEVYELCREINDPRIKYYKTPRNLHLSKSFEFVYLKAKGEFIISIGSDDALLPWGLKVIDEVINKYPKEDLIQWERGFYAWPGFNGGQENELFVPREYKKGEYEFYEVEREEYLAKVLNNPQEMYSLPMLYINSGFKRSYIKKIYKQTGRLWDGICQDIYMGVINVGINKEILNIKYPITIAGMSSSSIGYLANKAIEDVSKAKNDAVEVERTNNIGGFSMSYIERLMPQLGTDVSSLYNSLLRTVARGIFPIEYIDNLFDFKKMFIECYRLLDVRDVYYDKKIHYMRYTASLHGEEFLKWFDDTIYKEALIPRVIDEEKINSVSKKKTYSEGKTELGGIILDASKYNVSNIYEASKLFEKITNL
ncbi:glycosyltransferase [Clostridium sp. MSJ-8]|uniref:glycosyltransferase family 2 protein n=1 Tax=Clostridium sp. MSJ-8 TaxID=2841510 RepID=UPI001C0F20D3|nr:glycosyltransferase [Clostridium sp. MSJ-8]MBU5488409.1 glycosyltransferase [Clostridium sp. MSJ-8]